MDQILEQLGGLLLNAIPTVVVFLVLYVAYRLLVHNPLHRALDERRERTQGAIAKAQADVAAAEARTAEYENKIREAKVAIYKRQEALRHEWMERRTQLVAEARKQADAQVNAAKSDMDRDAAAARVTLEGEASRLAIEIVRAILKPAAGQQQAGVRP